MQGQARPGEYSQAVGKLTPEEDAVAQSAATGKHARRGFFLPALSTAAAGLPEPAADPPRNIELEFACTQYPTGAQRSSGNGYFGLNGDPLRSFKKTDRQWRKRRLPALQHKKPSKRCNPLHTSYLGSLQGASTVGVVTDYGAAHACKMNSWTDCIPLRDRCLDCPA